jgi:NTE family protein
MFDSLLRTKKYGLALGAGGARGFVHIGVIKALEELRIKITHIGGSSIGALIGGMYALWGDIQKVESIILNYDKKRLLDLFSTDIGLLHGVFKGDTVLEALEQYVGDSKISDCKIPFVAVSVDMLNGEKVYHTTGLLRDAMRASMSIPLIFKPYELDGKYLVDGGLAECVPVIATKSIGAKKVLGVNIEMFPLKNEKINLKNLSGRVYSASMYNLAKRDLELADKKLEFNLNDYTPIELVENAEKYIKMGYDETMRLFKK